MSIYWIFEDLTQEGWERWVAAVRREHRCLCYWGA